jgi:dynein light chain roadblock-type
MADAAAVDETFKRLQSHKGVLGALVVNGDGIAIRTTFENDITVQYAALVSGFVNKSRAAVRQLDSENELRFLRIRSKKHEVMIAPEFGKNHDYYLVVVQDPAVQPIA